MPQTNPDRLRSIKTLPSLLVYLRDELDWPIDSDKVDDVTFEYDPAELGFDAATTVGIKDVKQLRPLHSKQPWGVFWVNFEKKQLPVMMLRRALGHLVIKKRASASKPNQRAWQMNDLLFISAYGEEKDRAVTFAHFTQDHQAEGALPVLKVLGWDQDDTDQRVIATHQALTERLRWPDEPEDISDWQGQWSSAFTLRHREVITTTERLVEELARLATDIKEAVLFAVSRETEKGPWRRLLSAFQSALIHDLNEESFADVTAQTISYGLLTARLSTPGAITLQNLVDMVPRTNPFLRELLAHFVSSAGKRSLFDVDEVGIDDVVTLLNRANAEAIKTDFGNKTRGEDPVIHFYEHFLSAYNKKLKVDRGVFYTPRPVVSYIVRSVHELLQSEFGLLDGLADVATWGEVLVKHPRLKLPPLTDEPDEERTISPSEPFVQILDPATGTATFLVEVIDLIHRTLSAKWKKAGLSDSHRLAAWNDYVPKHLLTRLHGFELMMAPYAIAHMKIGLKLAETGYRFGRDERARIYLTNAIEPWARQLPLIGLDALAHEASAVNEVKRHKRFTVVIGNPPYSGISSNMTDDAQRIVDAYKVVDGGRLNERKLWLQDDYVKFVRRAQTTLGATKAGVFGYITNHGYLDNPTFRGMRQSLIGTFSNLRILDLHGNANKKETALDGSDDKNVFDIKQGVAICLATVGGASAVVAQADLHGSRESKYSWLDEHSVETSGFSPVQPASPFYLFKHRDTGLDAEFSRGWLITEAMPLNRAGFVTARDGFVIDFDHRVLEDRMRAFTDSSRSDSEIRNQFFDKHGTGKYAAGDTRGWKVPEARRRVRADKEMKSRIVNCLYRPFDTRAIYWAKWMVDWPRPEVMEPMLSGDNIGLVWIRPMSPQYDFSIGVSRWVVDQCALGNKSAGAGITYLAPLRLRDHERGQSQIEGLGADSNVNFAPQFMSSVRQCLESDPHSSALGRDDLEPERILAYTYAVFHSPGYRRRYAELLRRDFPRLPLTQVLELFRELSRLGQDLIDLHLLESPALKKSPTAFVGKVDAEVERVSWSSDTVWVNTLQTVGFNGVREDVWSFNVGGYQVCEKWLKDRKGQALSVDDIAHYRKIVGAIYETIRLMKEVDEAIEKYGGWPEAFAQKMTLVDDSLRTSSVIVDVMGREPDGQQGLPIDADPDPSELEPSENEKRSIDDVDSDELMSAIRQLFGDGGVRERGAAVVDVARELGFKRTASRIRETVDNAIRTAVRRGIVENSADGLRINARSIEDYDRDFLKEQFMASLQGKAWTDREDAIRTFGRWMGFKRTGSAIDETGRSLINGLIRDGRLESSGADIRRV